MVKWRTLGARGAAANAATVAFSTERRWSGWLRHSDHRLFGRTQGPFTEELAEVPRRRMFKTGVIEFEGIAIKCAVDNLSDTGASLQLAAPHYLPDRFTLSVPDDQFRWRCHMIWRKEKLIGVAFD